VNTPKRSTQNERIRAPRTHVGGRVPWAWVALLASHSELTRAMNAKLVSEHGLTLNDYEVLLHLSWAPGGRLRRGELAQRVRLTAGGITQLLKELERERLVTSAPDPADRRAVQASLTEAGRQRLAEAARTHVANVEAMFTARFSRQELANLGELLGRLVGTPPDGGRAGRSAPPRPRGV
jgi:DNA-binding MarR family transcriptional regulator